MALYHSSDYAKNLKSPKSGDGLLPETWQASSPGYRVPALSAVVVCSAPLCLLLKKPGLLDEAERQKR